MNLDSTNYYSPEANREYMSVSQFKSFEQCEFKAMQELAGTYTREPSTALLVGSYVDAYYSGSLNQFVEDHPEIKKKDGYLKADYVQAELIINRLNRDEMFTRYLSGEKQVIMTGEIESVPVKIRIDSYHPGKAIVDLKVMRDFNRVYVPAQGRLNFIEAWRYNLQGAVYQEIVRQNTGEQLPFFIAGVTKEATADLGIFEIPQDELDFQLDLFKAKVERYQLIKEGELEPERCEKCECCKSTKKLNKIITWEELNEYEF